MNELCKKKVWFILNVGLLLALCGFVSGAVKKGPYLIYEGNNTAMTVLWQMDSPESCTIEWGVTESYDNSIGTEEYGDDHQHKYAITNLTPGVKYYYQVTNSLVEQIGSGSFTAAPAVDATDVKFLVYGDTRSYPADHDAVNAEMITTYTVDSTYQTITLHVGDWVNAGESEADWTTQFFDPSYSNIHEFQANMPLNGCKGNHEGTTEYDGVLFKKYFPYPYDNKINFYWSFDYGPAHIAVVDQYTNYSPDSAQYEWLENDLSTSTKEWNFIVLHEPGWSAGGGHENNTAVQNYIQPLCLTYGVDIVFTGHNHYYARCVVDGVQHITTGGGGAPLRTPEMGYPYLVTAESVLHFCEIDIQGSQLNFVARRSVGTVLDTFTLSDKASNPSPTDQAVDVDINADLNWTAGSGANTHDVYLGVAPDMLDLVSAGQTETTYNPGPLDPETVYYWAVDEIGPGGTTTGDVWSFTTAAVPGQASNPQPPDETLSVPLETDLSWTAGSGANTHDVYLGVAPDMLDLVSEGQTATIYDPGPLDPETVYYWAVDEIGPGGETPGVIWTFTTVPPLPWSDGFESDDLTTGGWVTSGSVTITDDAFTGSYAVRTNRPASLEKAISTVGFGNITVSFACKTFGMDNGEFLYIEWSIDGINWYEIDTTRNEVTQWTEKTITCPTAAQDNPDFRVRFRSNADKNREYVFLDNVQISGIALAPDETAPRPDSMTWATAPYATGSSSIAMVATTASDPSGVEYYFTNVTVAGHDSGWQDSPIYEDTVLDPETPYTYTVKARDKSVNLNETSESESVLATTLPEDLTPPNPDPMWAVAPQPTGSTSVSMTVTTATDDSGVEYYFACIAGGGNDSGWQDSTTYEDTGLSPDTTYTYTVKARDKSPAQNVTAISVEAATTTLPMSSNVMYVQTVNLSWRKAGNNTFIIAEVMIYDGTSAPMQGATVTGLWSGPTSWTVSDITGPEGTATMSNKIKNPGTYSFMVTDVILNGYDYNPAMNNTPQIETEVTIP